MNEYDIAALCLSPISQSLAQPVDDTTGRTIDEDLSDPVDPLLVMLVALAIAIGVAALLVTTIYR